MSDRQFLDPLSPSYSDEPISAFDVETTGDDGQFLMGSIVGDGCRRNAPEVFWDQYDMLDALISKRFRYGKIYAHNLEYDLMALLEQGGYEYLEDQGYDIEIFHNGGSIIHCKVRDQSDHVWEFRDSMNVAMHMGVESMGEIIDLPKLGTEDHPLNADGDEIVIDFENRDAADYPEDVMETYNIRDSKVCYVFMSWLREQLHDLGASLEVTAAKTAMTLFRSQYLDQPIEQPREQILRKSYEGYYGGRVSPLVKGHIDGPVREYDVASLYPYCMQVTEFPDPSAIRYDRGNGKYTDQQQRERIWDAEGMTKCTVKAPDMDIPVLPTKWDDKLLFPTGHITDWWCHNELRFALERGYEIVDVEESIWSERTFNPFDDYVQDLFDKRLQYRDEDNATEFVVKLMMNSLYGKFGQRIEIDDGGLYKRASKIDSAGDLVGSRVIGDWFIESIDYDDDDEGNGIPSYINPMLAAYVTARGRTELYKWFEYVQDAGGRVLYCDTDSVWTDTKLENVQDDKRLGQLDYEGKYDDLYVFGPKMYVADAEDKETKITAKGVPYSQMQQMWEAIQDGRGKIEYQKIAGMREGFRSDDFDPIDVIDKHRTVRIAKESKRKFRGLPSHERMLDREQVTDPFDMDNLQTELAKSEAARIRSRQRRIGSDSFESQTPGDRPVRDPAAQRDSELTASENKDALERAREREWKESNR